MGQESWRVPYQRAVAAHKVATLGREAGMSDLSDIVTRAYRGFVSDLGRACLLGLLAAGAAIAARRRWAPAAVTSLVALALLCFDLWPVSGRLSAPVIGPRVERPLEVGYDDVVEFLTQAGPPGTFRVFPLTEFQSNRLAGFGVASVGGYHAAKPRRVQTLIEKQLLASPWWSRLLNVRYFIADGHIQNAPPSWTEVYNGTQNVFENALALPRATLVGAYRVVQPDSALLDSVGTVDPAAVTFLDHDPGLTLGPVTGGKAGIVSYRLNDVTIESDSPGPALLRLADQWFPGWVATVDGKPVEILRADYLLRAVPVPAGRHRVEFHYRPRAIRQGLMVSLASLAAILALLLSARLRPRPPAPAAGVT
jgi:hypothetical protein